MGAQAMMCCIAVVKGCPKFCDQDAFAGDRSFAVIERLRREADRRISRGHGAAVRWQKKALETRKAKCFKDLNERAAGRLKSYENQKAIRIKSFVSEW
jgi:hypothetical protein